MRNSILMKLRSSKILKLDGQTPALTTAKSDPVDASGLAPWEKMTKAAYTD